MSAHNDRADIASRATADAEMLTGLLTPLAAAALAVVLFTAPIQAKTLEPRALKALFPGTFEAVVHGYAVSFTAHGDGSLVGRYAVMTDTGRWSIKQGRLCIMLSSWLSGRTTCAKVVQHGPWYRADKVQFRKP